MESKATGEICAISFLVLSCTLQTLCKEFSLLAVTHNSIMRLLALVEMATQCGVPGSFLQFDGNGDGSWRTQLRELNTARAMTVNQTYKVTSECISAENTVTTQILLTLVKGLGLTLDPVLENNFSAEHAVTRQILTESFKI